MISYVIASSGHFERHSSSVTPGTGPMSHGVSAKAVMGQLSVPGPRKLLGPRPAIGSPSSSSDVPVEAGFSLSSSQDDAQFSAVRQSQGILWTIFPSSVVYMMGAKL